MKNLITSLLLLLIITSCKKDKSEAVLIPDSNFKNYLLDNKEVNFNKDDKISHAEASSFKGSLELTGVNDFTGIEAFNLLENISIYESFGTIIDLTNNTKLFSLGCFNSGTLSIDISQNQILNYLLVKDNDQLSFNLTNCQNIEFIECHNSGIKEFDVSDCTALRQFFSIGNSLTDLNLTANRNLELINVFNDSTIKSIFY